MDLLGDDLDQTELLQHLCQQAWPWRTAPLRIEPLRHIPEDEWEGSREYRWLLQMLERCYPTERSQLQ